MAHKLTAPRMGEGVEELNVVKWLKQQGDPVKELEPIVEVETDKVVTEIPSPASGVVLKILVGQDQTVKVGGILAWIGEPGEVIGADTPETPAIKKTPQPSAKTVAAALTQPAAKDGFLSPLVRKIAAENNLDLSQVRGSGQDGRITKQNVLAFLELRGTDTPTSNTVTPAPFAPAPITDTLQPLSSLRRQIAERMVNSLRTSPHVLTVMEADLSRVQAHRALNKPLFAQDGVNLTLTAYFISAIVAGLKANPLVNSSWTDAGLQIHPDINIGMAVSLGAEGLIVPVLKNADSLSLLGVARMVNDLANRARTKKLLSEEVRSGTFSLTNHGLGGSLFASPIITQPQVGILGTGAMQKRAVVLTDEDGNDSIAIRSMLYLSFVFDHRVLDGEAADNFLVKVKETLENWT
ncbi:MAG: hypothetical protein FD147_2354 [Chloroflexi bacterium]|nr:MAG: hypothetical protein FD147_2354 [Chloroflexota bacterium]